MVVVLGRLSTLVALCVCGPVSGMSGKHSYATCLAVNGSYPESPYPESLKCGRGKGTVKSCGLGFTKQDKTRWEVYRVRGRVDEAGGGGGRRSFVPPGGGGVAAQVNRECTRRCCQDRPMLPGRQRTKEKDMSCCALAWWVVLLMLIGCLMLSPLVFVTLPNLLIYFCGVPDGNEEWVWTLFGPYDAREGHVQQGRTRGIARQWSDSFRGDRRRKHYRTRDEGGGFEMEAPVAHVVEATAPKGGAPFCPGCGNAFLADSLFCRQCGGPRPAL